MGNLLFDSSSIIQALKLRRPEILYRNHTQHLAIYEALNALWKETLLTRSLTPQEARILAEILSEILENMGIHTIHPYEAEVLAEAVELGLTAYDASYVVIARRNGFTLVTEDRRLRDKAGDGVEVTSVEELLRHQPASP